MLLIAQSTVTYSVIVSCHPTDSDVFFTLFGQNGNTGRQKLGKMQKKGFNWYKFELQLIDVGKMERLVVEIEFREGGETEWHLNYFTVTNRSRGEKAVFSANCILSKKEDGSPTTKELLPRIIPNTS